MGSDFAIEPMTMRCLDSPISCFQSISAFYLFAAAPNTRTICSSLTSVATLCCFGPSSISLVGLNEIRKSLRSFFAFCALAAGPRLSCGRAKLSI